jgi:hypothetical protein
MFPQWRPAHVMSGCRAATSRYSGLILNRLAVGSSDHDEKSLPFEGFWPTPSPRRQGPVVAPPKLGDTAPWACGRGAWTLPSVPSGRLPMLPRAPRRRPSSIAGMSSLSPAGTCWSPTIRAALIAGTPWLDVFGPGCGTSRAIDLRKVHRHPLASVATLVLGLRCSWCRPSSWSWGKSGRPTRPHPTKIHAASSQDIFRVPRARNGNPSLPHRKARVPVTGLFHRKWDESADREPTANGDSCQIKCTGADLLLAVVAGRQRGRFRPR